MKYLQKVGMFVKHMKQSEITAVVYCDNGLFQNIWTVYSDLFTSDYLIPQLYENYFRSHHKLLTTVDKLDTNWILVTTTLYLFLQWERWSLP